jgi:hypothetical protein
MRVRAEAKKGSENGNGRYVRCTNAAHDYGENVDSGTSPMSVNGIGWGVYSSRISRAVWETDFNI